MDLCSSWCFLWVGPGCFPPGAVLNVVSVVLVEQGVVVGYPPVAVIVFLTIASSGACLSGPARTALANASRTKVDEKCMLICF